MIWTIQTYKIIVYLIEVIFLGPLPRSYEGFIPVRYLIAFFGFLGFTFNYMLRVNFNFTIVSMVNFYPDNSTSNSSSECGFQENNENSTVTNEVNLRIPINFLR